MAVPVLETAPVLSTPDTHIFEDPTPAVDTSNLSRLSDEQIALTYEIERTVREIKDGRWRRIALQFPDHMLTDAPRVYEQLTRGLKIRKAQNTSQKSDQQNGIKVEEDFTTRLGNTTLEEAKIEEESLFILGDTSYGACCVDEVAAEHVDADVVVHYGRSCLSPPSRLPVIYVFTERPLDLNPLISTFTETYPDKQAKIILMADIPYSHHIPVLHKRLQDDGYPNIYATTIVHNPSSLLPNRTVPPEAQDDKDALQHYALFHISDPPTALLLTLSSRVSSIHIYPTNTPTPPSASQANPSRALRRRYALLTSLSTTPVFGILINTLSVKNYMHILSHVQAAITAAGKKYYTFVVGKVNAAKVANFSEVGGWVVIGCWESSLIESDEFWRPMITPWELGVALQADDERVWTGNWDADFQAVLDEEGEREREKEVEVEVEKSNGTANAHVRVEIETQAEEGGHGTGDYDSEEESAPPEFDLRTGRYVSHSRPMRTPTFTSTSTSTKPLNSPQTANSPPAQQPSTALTKRGTGAIASVAGVASPGAEYLRSKRTWQGLGSDYRNGDGGDEEGEGQGHPSVGVRAARMEEGRRGIARGYVVGAEGEGGRH
ncbi:diphthamide biosynthesis protein 2 [Pyrenochaeta sp. DS3sAY3a]|nr:diphthamide biosynthesis protein 2 [Pyrenochaeta sp. DS3sAY3a]